MSATFYCYLHLRPDGSLFYVGKGQGKRSHEFTAGRNQYHKNIVAKYGAENIRVSIIPCESEDHAFATEIQLIKSFRLVGDELANMTDGGEGASGLIQTPDLIAKRTAAFKASLLKNGSKKRGPQSAEHREANAAGNRGRKHENPVSRYVGVSRKNGRKYKSWRARLWSNNRESYIGNYESELEAAQAVDAYVIEQGLKYPLNFPLEADAARASGTQGTPKEAV